jgi:hypothetical protein
MFGRKVILHSNDDTPSATCDAPTERIDERRIAEDPATTMQIDNDGERTLAYGNVDLNGNGPNWTRNLVLLDTGDRLIPQ